MNFLEKKIIKKIEESGDFDFQGFKISAFLSGKKCLSLSMGKTYKYYDIASITKLVFTTSVLMRAVENKVIRLDTKVSTILPWYKHKKIEVGHLLNHTAGNEWWQPFYKKIDLSLSPEEKFLQIQRMVRDVPVEKSKKAVYSDIDFYLLGSIIEKIYSKSLYEVWLDYKAKVFLKSQFHFNYKNEKIKAKDYAPTEECPWRKEVLCGQVHDENAWSIGGVAPHAGLFGRIDDLADWGLKIRKIYRENQGFVKKQTLNQFSRRSLPSSRGDWGYGFMVPSRSGSTAGELFSKKSFGHTGFTGTSIWYDPEADLLICLLSNRVYPSRKNKGFIRLRPKLHDWIWQEVSGK